MLQEKVTVYPSHYVTEAVLKDGSIMRLSPIKLSDTAVWLDFVNNVSSHTKYLRFHHVTKDMTIEDAVRYCTVDYDNTMAFVAEVTKRGQRKIVAIGRYYRLPNGHSAEVAFMIDDKYQGKGVGTKLMEALVGVARDHGITHFEADVLAENEQMMEVFLEYGFHVDSDLDLGEYHVDFPIGRTRRVTMKEEVRERIARVNSLVPMLSPRSIAVIGASRSPNTLGNIVLRCILQSGYLGVVYPVNPNATSIMAVRAYPSILDVPDDVDVAIILVPAPLVAKVADECGHKGVRSIIVISDGFKERGAEGGAREAELRDIALGYGMRLVGPNCMGVINTNSAISLNATFSPVYPSPGNVAFLSQSGAMGLTILKHADNLNIGISSFLSVGNRADVSAVDLL